MAGLGPYRDDTKVQQAWADIKQHGAAAAANLARLLQ
jgi:hypothetical protein